MGTISFGICMIIFKMESSLWVLSNFPQPIYKCFPGQDYSSFMLHWISRIALDFTISICHSRSVDSFLDFIFVLMRGHRTDFICSIALCLRFTFGQGEISADKSRTDLKGAISHYTQFVGLQYFWPNSDHPVWNFNVLSAFPISIVPDLITL